MTKTANKVAFLNNKAVWWLFKTRFTLFPKTKLVWCLFKIRFTNQICWICSYVNIFITFFYNLSEYFFIFFIFSLSHLILFTTHTDSREKNTYFTILQVNTAGSMYLLQIEGWYICACKYNYITSKLNKLFFRL